MFAEKNVSAKATHTFFSKNIWTNDIVSFEQLDPG